MARHTAALKFLKKSKECPVHWPEKKIAELPMEVQKELPAPRSGVDAKRDPKGATADWLRDIKAAETKIRRELGEASRRHARTCINRHTGPAFTRGRSIPDRTGPSLEAELRV